MVGRNFNKEDILESDGLLDREDEMEESNRKTTSQYQTNEDTVLLETAGFLPLNKIA